MWKKEEKRGKRKRTSFSISPSGKVTQPRALSEKPVGTERGSGSTSGGRSHLGQRRETERGRVRREGKSSSLMKKINLQIIFFK